MQLIQLVVFSVWINYNFEILEENCVNLFDSQIISKLSKHFRCTNFRFEEKLYFAYLDLIFIHVFHTSSVFEIKTNFSRKNLYEKESFVLFCVHSKIKLNVLEIEKCERMDGYTTSSGLPRMWYVQIFSHDLWRKIQVHILRYYWYMLFVHLWYNQFRLWYDNWIWIAQKVVAIPGIDGKFRKIRIFWILSQFSVFFYILIYRR